LVGEFAKVIAHSRKHNPAMLSVQFRLQLEAGHARHANIGNQEVINPNQVEMLSDEACRHALNQRGVAHITFPVDYQEYRLSRKRKMHKVEGSSVRRRSSDHEMRQALPLF
jgi:thiamine pyrophosphate-dependent acetolactate synthase large subunit-like protein